MVRVLVSHAQCRVIGTRYHLCSSFKEALSLTPAPKVLAIDIPIGLLDRHRSEAGNATGRQDAF